jgi:hypothetical protein
LRAINQEFAVGFLGLFAPADLTMSSYDALAARAARIGSATSFGNLDLCQIFGVLANGDPIPVDLMESMLASIHPHPGAFVTPLFHIRDDDTDPTRALNALEAAFREGKVQVSALQFRICILMVHPGGHYVCNHLDFQLSPVVQCTVSELDSRPLPSVTV